MLANQLLASFLGNSNQPVFLDLIYFNKLGVDRFVNLSQLTVELTPIRSIGSQLVNFLLKAMTHKGVPGGVGGFSIEGVKEAVYMAWEIPLLKGMDKEKLTAIYSVKKIFP
jgi:hypothetical protein